MLSTILEKDVEKEYVGGQKKAKGNLDWNGMQKGEFGMKKVFGLHLCVSEKKICFEFIFYLKTIDSWHIVSEIIFVFHPFMQQRQIVDVIAVWKLVEADKLAI